MAQKGNETMATKKIAATKKANASAKKENNAAMEKKIDRLTSEIVAQILANVDLDAIVKKVVAENPAPAKAGRAELLKEFKTANKGWYDLIKGDKDRLQEFNAAAELWAKAKLDEAPAKEAKVEKKPRFTEKQLAAQKAWGERQKAKASTFSTINSPEYQELWARWKEKHAGEYSEATKRADKQVLNKAGHKWVMEQLEKKSAAPAKKATAKKTTKK